MVTIYIVVTIDPCGYDSWDSSYHRTRKGALRSIIARSYENWEQCRYIQPGSYDDLSMYVREVQLEE